MRQVLIVWALCVSALAAPPSDIVVTGGPPEVESSSATPTTDKPLAPIEIYSVHVTSEVSSRYAKTVVSSRVANPGHKAQEVTFSVLLPETAFISGFLMEINGKVYEAYVKEKEDAKKIYQDAVQSGFAAAHVTAKARDSNHFTVAVNVEPNSKTTFNLTYEELLSRRLGVYNNIINLNPGKIVPDLSVVVHIKENRPITTLRVPELRSGNEIDADEHDKANDMAAIERSSDNKEATITFKPTADQQRQLRDLFREKLRAEKEKARGRQEHSYFEHFNNDDEQKSSESDGLNGQFVVQYDVERDPQNGEVLIYDGYFVHFFAPSDLKPLNKHVVFVLDVSGSMIGRKIVQLKEAMLSILDNLNPGDYFSIIEFSFDSKVYNLDHLADSPVYGEQNRGSYFYYQEKHPEPPKGPLPPPYPVTPDNIEKAKKVINNLEATGGTNINDALTTALRVVNARPDSKEDLPKPIANVENKDDSSSSDSSQEDKKPEEEKKDSASVEDTDVQVKDKVNAPEPIIIFLTDGDATSGETRPEKILSTVSELNSGKRKAAIFCLAFGEDADRNILQKLALRNSGFLRHIYEAADASQQLQHFYQQVSSPLLAGVSFIYPEDQVEKNTITKDVFHTLFRGGEIIVAGKMKNTEITNLTPSVSALSLRGPIDFIPKAPIPEITKKHFEPTERLWAYLTIKQLLDEKDARIGNEDSDKPKEPESPKEGADSQKPPVEEKPEVIKKKETAEEKALRLALKYSFVTPLTSLVVVKPNETSAVNAESVDNANRNAYPQAFAAGLQPLAGGAVPLSLQYARPAFGGFAAQSAAGQPSQPFLTSYNIMDRFDSPPPAPIDMDMDSLVGSAYVPYKTSTPIVVTSTANPGPLDKYNLQMYTWMNDYFVAGPPERLELPIDQKTVSLKLEQDLTKLSSVDPPCSNSVNGGEGVCKYLTQCNSDSVIPLSNLSTYLKYYCSRDGYAGVCCAADP